MKLRVIPAVAAVGLALAAGVIAASDGTGHSAAHAVLAAQSKSFPSVDLDNCPTLHVGYPTGGCVAQLQTELKTVQDPALVVDGTFGSQTYNAVSAFQGTHGLTRDGLAGSATKTALEAAVAAASVPTSSAPPTTTTPATTPSAPPSPATSSPALGDDPADSPKLPEYKSPPDLSDCPSLLPQLFQYSDGVYQPQGCVAALQQNLDAVGFRLHITGDYSPLTYEAVWNFQQAHSSDSGLSVTGRADPSTLSVLDRIANSPAGLAGNGVDGNGNDEVQAPLPAPITTVQLQTNTPPTMEEQQDDCATTCDQDDDG